MQIGIGKIAISLACETMSIDEILAATEEKESLLQETRKNGLSRVPVEFQRNLAEMAGDALHDLSKMIDGFKTQNAGIIFAHSVPLVAPPEIDFFGEVFKRANVPEVPVVAVSGQPCAIIHEATVLAQQWGRTLDHDSGIVLLGADMAYSHEERVFFGSVMGDAAFAGWLSPHCKNIRILASKTNTNLLAAYGTASSPEDIQRFRFQNPHLIKRIIMETLAEANLRIEDIRYIVPHTPNVKIWDVVSELMEIKRDKFLTNYISETGHFSSNDVFIHFHTARQEGLIGNGDIVLLVSAGFGGTQGVTILKSDEG